MARRLTTIVVLAVAVFGLTACGSSSSPKAAPAFDARKITVGEIDVSITPIRLDATGAEFNIVFDTHAGSLDTDVAGNATLTVNTTRWTAPIWSGDGPGGHHRSGTLRFTAAGPATGTAELTISGLSAPANTSWQLPAP